MNFSFISVRTQYENLGDALINRELIGLLSAQGKLVVDVSGVPVWFVDMLALPADAVRVRGQLRLLGHMVLRRLAGHRVYHFFIPGGMRGEYSRHQFFRKCVSLLPYYALSLLGARFCQVGLSFESLGPRHTAYLRLRNRVMHAFHVRDRGSSELLTSLGVAHCGLLPDLAFNTFESGRREIRPTAAACFSFRTDQHLEQLEDCYEAMQRAIRALPKQTRYFLVVQVERDRAGMETIRARLRDELGIEARIHQETRDIERLRDFYRGMDVVISNRLHVLLLGAGVGARSIAYVDEANQKISGMFETIGRADLVLRRDDSGDSKVSLALVAEPVDGGAQQAALSKGFAQIFSSRPSASTQ